MNWTEEQEKEVIDMRTFTTEEKELIINTPITFECFEMIDSFSDYDDLGLYELGALYSDWESLIKNPYLCYVIKKEKEYGKHNSQNRKVLS